MRYDEASEFIEMTIPLENDEDQVEGVLVISTPTNDIQESRSVLSHKVLLLQIGMAALVFLAALYTSKLLIRPFGKVTQSLDEMTGGFLEEDISIPDYTETQLLSEAYNRMLKRLRVLEDSRQEFVSNVSHELKTRSSTTSYPLSSWIKRRRIFILKTKISTSFWIRSSSA